jgi:hypothetical protein
MRRFKTNNGRFGALVGLIALSAMIIVFAINLPVFSASSTGQIFAVVWSMFALAMFMAQAVRLVPDRHRQPVIRPSFAGVKDARTRKNIRSLRTMHD